MMGYKIIRWAVNLFARHLLDFVLHHFACRVLAWWGCGHLAL